MVARRAVIETGAQLWRKPIGRLKNRDEFYGAEIRGRGGVRSGALGRLEPSSAQQERAMREGIRDRESGNQVVVDGVRRGLGAVGRCCLVEDVVMW